jgi:adenylosuccinate synthase
MGVTAVIGLQWGDEGKGKIVDVLCERADLVVRCQGGSNAGHTVVTDGRKFVLHLVPSGILREGAVCLIGNGVAVDLELLAAELRDLEAAGIKTEGRLVVSRRAHLVLPHHKRIDQAEEAGRGGAKIGTTMRGIGPCYTDKYGRFGIRLGDLLDPSVVGTRIRAAALAHAGGPAGSRGPGERPAFNADEVDAYCRKYLPLVKEVAGDVAAILVDALADAKEIVLEGAQGFLLDIDHGTYPYVTSSNTGVHGLTTGSGLPPSAIDSVVGVLKAYVTRVGEGPFPTEMEEPYQTLVREKGREFGATTGRPRKCGWLDLPALEYACALNGVTSLVLTKLDTLSDIDAVKVCVAYEHSGMAVRSFPTETDYLAGCAGRYVTCDTWTGLEGSRQVTGLPPGAKKYLERIEARAGAPIALVSIGPARGDVIQVQD